MSVDINDPILQFFAFEHLPERLQAVSRHFSLLAHFIVVSQADSNQRRVALQRLLESKDAAVRSALFADHASNDHDRGCSMVVTVGDLHDEIDRVIEAVGNLARATNSRLSDLADAQDAQAAQLSAINNQGSQIMSTLDDDTAAIAAQTTVVASLATFVQGLQAQIAALPGLTAAQQTAIDGIFTSVTANNAALAAAMVVNTKVAPTPAAAAAAVK